MAPFFTVFPSKDLLLRTTHTTETLGKYYKFFVDGTEFEKPAESNKYKECNGRFFVMDETSLKMYRFEDLKDHPQFLLTFDSEDVKTDDEWKFIEEWLDNVFKGKEKDNDKMFDIVPKATDCDEKTTIGNQIERKITPEERDYRFRYFEDESRNMCLAEICKPFTDRPYTIVIRSYLQRGLVPLFTGIYICSSWGVTSFDHIFLERLWTHLHLDHKVGKLDLQNRLKEAIEKCTPSKNSVPESEPEVYRLKIEQVLQLWSNKRGSHLMSEENENEIELLTKNIKEKMKY